MDHPAAWRDERPLVFRRQNGGLRPDQKPAGAPGTIEPLSKRLPKEENLDIRENLVKILATSAGNVDALVRTVTGEERARQELLSNTP